MLQRYSKKYRTKGRHLIARTIALVPAMLVLPFSSFLQPPADPASLATSSTSSAETTSTSWLIPPSRKVEHSRVPEAVTRAPLKGLPYSLYHGRTGIVFNVNRNALGHGLKRAVSAATVNCKLKLPCCDSGVEITKIVGNRQLRKRLHVRDPQAEHRSRVYGVAACSTGGAGKDPEALRRSRCSRF